MNKTIATVEHQNENEIRFLVDDVEQDRSPLAKLPAPASLEKALGCQPLIFSHDDSHHFITDTTDKIYESSIHPLVQAVHLAFSQHRPLILTPDTIWMTVSQGFAQHINNNAEEIRKRFVRHTGKLTLKAETLQLESLADWQQIIDNWIEKIFTHIDPTLHRLLLCDFTTTTKAIRTASHIVIMDAFQEYFDYRLYCICGIPNITLRGSCKDWQTIRMHAEELADYDLGWWTARLLPILDEFVETAAGRPRRKFWQDIYKPEGRYGGDVVTGWIADLFPYLNDYVTNAPTLRNPQFDTPRDEINPDHGIPPRLFPRGLSQAPFILETRDSKHALQLVGGFVGIIEHTESGKLETEIGWAVVPAGSFEILLDQLVTEHKNNPAIDRDISERWQEMPKELIQIAQRTNGMTLFADTEHSWRFLPPSDYYSCEIPLPGQHQWVVQFITLNDDRAISYDFISIPERDEAGKLIDFHYELWIAVGKLVEEPPNADDLPVDEITGVPTGETAQSKRYLHNPVVIAKSIPELFERIVTANGQYYFDDPDFCPADSYANLER